MTNKKEEMYEKYYATFGTKIVLKSGIIIKDNFYDNVLSGLLARWRGLLDSNNMTYGDKNVYPLTKTEKFEFIKIKNIEGENIEFPFNHIAYIQFTRNTSSYGPKRAENEYFDEYLFK